MSHAGNNGAEEDAARIEKMLGDSRAIDYLEDRLRIRIEAVVEQRIRVEGRMRFKRQPSPAKKLYQLQRQRPQRKSCSRIGGSPSFCERY